MSLPRVTTTESFKGKGLTRCSRCGDSGVPLSRNANRKWLCGKCDPALPMRVVVEGEKKA